MLKDDVKEMIDTLPENCTIEDIRYTLYVRSKIEIGQKNIDEVNFFTHDEINARMDNKNNQ
ncbi:hypothetical protein OIN60_15480 [Paenibacillus sp. P96]|uniref:Uncharacterized protein n=1 Tax=Paenibacillus zeirhizosphaerae TaxID=2987519 RepID=A0ABT9FTV8_9BACL|nr:hypothetical protein [Paenibacillus sp. P96]MDP4098159.1 hypothetical protein [Paenibacillus sp. P96]